MTSREVAFRRKNDNVSPYIICTQGGKHVSVYTHCTLDTQKAKKEKKRKKNEKKDVKKTYIRLLRFSIKTYSQGRGGEGGQRRKGCWLA